MKRGQTLDWAENKANKGNGDQSNSAKREPKRAPITEHKPAFAECRGTAISACDTRVLPQETGNSLIRGTCSHQGRLHVSAFDRPLLASRIAIPRRSLVLYPSLSRLKH